MRTRKLNEMRDARRRSGEARKDTLLEFVGSDLLLGQASLCQRLIAPLATKQRHEPLGGVLSRQRGVEHQLPREGEQSALLHTAEMFRLRRRTDTAGHRPIPMGIGEVLVHQGGVGAAIIETRSLRCAGELGDVAAATIDGASAHVVTRLDSRYGLCPLSRPPRREPGSAAEIDHDRMCHARIRCEDLAELKRRRGTIGVVEVGESGEPVRLRRERIRHG